MLKHWGAGISVLCGTVPDQHQCRLREIFLHDTECLAQVEACGKCLIEPNTVKAMDPPTPGNAPSQNAELSRSRRRLNRDEVKVERISRSLYRQKGWRLPAPVK